VIDTVVEVSVVIDLILLVDVSASSSELDAALRLKEGPH
jgi:hypothetical protein